MSIGLYDQDMIINGLLPFNLELMKLSSYYKKRGEITILSPTFSPELHKLFFLRKDFQNGKFLKGLHKIKNLEYGGLAYTNNIYIPMIQEIEQNKPDTQIYYKFQKQLTNNIEYKKGIFNAMMRAEHCRLSLDGNNIWNNFTSQFINPSNSNLIIFHDYDLSKIEGSLEEIKNIINFYSTKKVNKIRIGMKYPPILYSGENLIKWLDINPNATFYSMRFNGVIDQDNFNKFIKKNSQRAFYKQLEYYVTFTSKNQEEFIEKYICQIYNQIMIARKYNINIKILYELDFFKDKRWERILDLFNMYRASLSKISSAVYYRKISEDTMYDFVKHLNEDVFYIGKGIKPINKQEARELFLFVGKQKPELFDYFYNLNANGVTI